MEGPLPRRRWGPRTYALVAVVAIGALLIIKILRIVGGPAIQSWLLIAFALVVILFAAIAIRLRINRTPPADIPPSRGDRLP